LCDVPKFSDAQRREALLNSVTLYANYRPDVLEPMHSPQHFTLSMYDRSLFSLCFKRHQGTLVSSLFDTVTNTVVNWFGQALLGAQKATSFQQNPVVPVFSPFLSENPRAILPFLENSDSFHFFDFSQSRLPHHFIDSEIARYRLQRLLSDNIAAQQEAIQLVIGEYNRTQWHGGDSAPMVLHIAGDNGVGKSHLASLISRALFYSSHPTELETSAQGMYVVYGHEYRTIGSNFEGVEPNPSSSSSSSEDNHQLGAMIFQELEKKTKHIIERIQHQLEHVYGGSIIFIDDFQLIHPHIALQLAKTFFSQKRYQHAIFLLASNFGDEALTTGWTLHEIVHHIRTNTSRTLYQSQVFTNGKVIPLRSYTTLESFYQITANKFRSLLCRPNIVNHIGSESPTIFYQAQLVKYVATQAWRKPERLGMGRCISNTIDQLIVDPLLTFLVRHSINNKKNQKNQAKLQKNQAVVIELDRTIQFRIITVDQVEQLIQI